MSLFHQLIFPDRDRARLSAPICYIAFLGFWTFWGNAEFGLLLHFLTWAGVGAVLIVIGAEVCAGPALLAPHRTTTIFPTADKCVKHYKL